MPAQHTIISLSQEDDDGWRANRRVLAGKGQCARVPIDVKTGDYVAPLITGKKEISCGIDVKAAGIIAACPNLTRKCQGATVPDGEEHDAVVQPIGRVYEFSVRRNHDLGCEARAGETLRQA